MTTVTVETFIAASPDAVFRAVSEIEHFPDINPAVERVAFLGDQRQGAGTLFREVRVINGKEMAFDLEIAGYEPDAGTIRFVNETHGTVWDTTITLTAQGDGTRAVFAMDCIGSTAFKRFMNSVLSWLYKRGMVEHVAGLKAYCEA